MMPAYLLVPVLFESLTQMKELTGVGGVQVPKSLPDASPSHTLTAIDSFAVQFWPQSGHSGGTAGLGTTSGAGSTNTGGLGSASGVESTDTEGLTGGSSGIGAELSAFAGGLSAGSAMSASATMVIRENNILFMIFTPKCRLIALFTKFSARIKQYQSK